MPSHYGDSDKLIDQQLLENIIRDRSMRPIGFDPNLSSPATTMRIPPAAPPPVMRGSGQTAISPKLTQALMNQGINPGPVTSKTQMFAKMGTAAIGGVLERMRTDDAQEVKSRIAQAISSIPGIPPEMVASVNALARHNPAAALKIIASERKNAAGKGKYTTKIIDGERYQVGPTGKLESFPRRKAPTSRTVERGGKKLTEQYNPDTGEWEVIAKSQARPPSQMERFMNKLNLTPRQQKDFMAQWLAAQSKGIEFIYTGRDGVEVKFGSKGSPQGIGTAGENMLDKKSIQIAEQLAALDGIAAKTDLEFLTTPNKLKNWWTGIRSRFGYSKSITDEDKEEYSEFVAFNRRSKDNFVKLLNALSGAAVSPHEMKNIATTIPDPGGQTLFDILSGSGDAPIAFSSKLNDAKYMAMASLMRLHYYRQQGKISQNGVIPIDPATNKVNKKFFGLTKFQAFIDKKFDEITDRLRKDGKSGNKLFNARDREMAAIFGLAWRPIE